MDSGVEKRGVKRDRSGSSSVGISTPTPATARKIKDRPRVRKVCPTKSRMLSFNSKTSSRSSRICYRGRSKGSSSSGSGSSSDLERTVKSIESTAIEISVLLHEGQITLDESTRAVEKFRNCHGLRTLWSNMSVENKIEYVKDLGDQFVQGSNQEVQIT